MTPMSSETIRSRIAPGACATLWTPRPMSETLTPRVKRILFEAKPQIVCLHGMPESIETSAHPLWSQLILAAREKNWIPRPWVGVACDLLIRQVIAKYVPMSKAIAKLWSAACVAGDMGAELVAWDAEAACKIAPSTAGTLAKETIAAVRSSHPHLVQAHTAYYVPTNHSETTSHGDPLPHGYPWTAWCGSDGVDVDWTQVYVAPPEPESGPRIMASAGSMLHALKSHRASWFLAQERGWIRSNLEAWIYLQLHHVPYEQTITYGSDPRTDLRSPSETFGVQRYVTGGWTVAKDYCDTDGEISLKALSELARRKQTVRQFQASAGLKEDGIAGPVTLNALGVFR